MRKLLEAEYCETKFYTNWKLGKLGESNSVEIGRVDTVKIVRNNVKEYAKVKMSWEFWRYKNYCETAIAKCCDKNEFNRVRIV